MSVIEQITYLLFAKRMDELHLVKEAQSNVLDTPIENPIFEPGQDHLRWSRFKDFEPERKFNVFKDKVFPCIKSLNGSAGSAYTKIIKDAVFIIPDQISFLNEVIEYLVRNGVMDPNRMHKAPFTDFHEIGLTGVLGENLADRVVGLVRKIDENAEVA